LQRTNERHWARTRAVIHSMEQAHSSMHSTGGSVHSNSRSITLPSSEMECLMSEVEAMSDERQESLERHATSSSYSPPFKSKNCKSPHNESENTGDLTLKLKSFDALDGTWELADENDHVEDWLQRLVISGTRVKDGLGLRTNLVQSPDGRILLEGGTVLLVDGLLHRIGKSKKRLKFKRVCTSGACIQSM